MTTEVRNPNPESVRHFFARLSPRERALFAALDRGDRSRFCVKFDVDAELARVRAQRGV